jgi:flagellar assembly protein FliH
METIIDANGDLSRHKIQKYAFKKLDVNDDTTHIHETAPQEQVQQAQSLPDYEEDTPKKTSLLDAKELKELSSSQSTMLRRIEELYTFVETMRGDLNNQSQTMSQHFEQNLQQTFQNGIKTGEEENRKKLDQEMQDMKSRINEAINTFATETQKVQGLLENLEDALVKTSIEIAQEVIKVSLDERAEQIALALSKELINDLKSASDITIKVNPYDIDFIINNINNEKINVEGDIAVARGGVVVLSNIGNIDGSIKERFAKVKATFYENMNKE